MKKLTKSSIFVITFAISIFLLIYLCNIVYTTFLNKLYMENYFQNNTVFSINKIVLFSSASGDSVVNSNNTTTINNLIQYTDIAIFIDNTAGEYTLENTLKSVSIENLSIITTPEVGNANIYYKGLDSFSTPQISENNIIDTNLNFEVSSEDTIDYSKPILYNNCANPITISYVNSNLIDNYTINNENQIAYDGSLLKDCNIVLNDLKCSFSFYIVIENNLGYKYRCPVYIDIPLSNENTSIYDGTYIYTYNPNYEFYLYTNSSELVS